MKGIYNPTKKKLKELLLLIIKEEGKRIPEYAVATNDSEKNVERYVAKLKAEGLIDFKGAPKDGRYVITEVLKKKLKK